MAVMDGNAPASNYACRMPTELLFRVGYRNCGQEKRVTSPETKGEDRNAILSADGRDEGFGDGTAGSKLQVIWQDS